MKFNQNDPRISAYILDELDAENRAEMEREIAANPELATFVDELRKTGTTLSAKLHEQATPMRLNADQRGKILNLNDETNSTARRGIFSWLTPSKAVFAAGMAAVLVVAFCLLVLVKNPQNSSLADSGKPKEQAVPVAIFPNKAPEIAQNSTGDKSLVVNNIGGYASTYADHKLFAKSSTFLFDLWAVGTSIGWDTLKLGDSVESFEFGSSLGHDTSAGNKLFGCAEASIQKEKENNSPAIVGRALGYAGGSASRNKGSLEQAESVGNSDQMLAKKTRTSSDDKVVPSPPNADMARPAPQPVPGTTPQNESYLKKAENTWQFAANEPLSTFSIDVDTASYSNIRRFLSQGQLPPADAVRIEELLNYFTYDYPQPEGKNPFSVTTEIAACPWNAEHQLLRIGLKGKEIAEDSRPKMSLVFLIDVSGSMDSANRLPLVVKGFKLLVQKLKPDDRVAIVTYAGESCLALPSTPIREKEKIIAAIEALRAGGSTNGEGGIKKAYQVAKENFINDGFNRVILCTDGDFNVGDTGEESLAQMVQRQAKSGVFLNIYGFGMGNYKDSRLVQLADQGNGVYGYIDGYAEAQKIFSKQIISTLVPIAKDVKIQVDFNPAKVGAYRLVGYEKRMLNKEDFNNDKKDAGEIGAGHSVTALYEIVPPGKNIGGQVEPSKYMIDRKQVVPVVPIVAETNASNEIGTVRLRYKLPKEDESTRFDVAIAGQDLGYEKASVDFKFAAAVASFGMTLKDSPERGKADLGLAEKLAKMGKGEDKDNYRAEFIRLIETAKDSEGSND